MENQDFGNALSDVKKRVRHALEGADVSAPVPVAAPAVAPWTPPAEQGRENSKKPGGRKSPACTSTSWRQTLNCTA